MRCRPAVVIIENNHLLLMKYQYGSHLIYNLPGGNVEAEELLEDTLVRECQEELGIEVELGAMLCVGQVLSNEHRKGALHVLFEGKIVSGIPLLQPAETTAAELVWWPIARLPEITLYPNLGDVIHDYVITGKPAGFLGEINQPWVG